MSKMDESFEFHNALRNAVEQIQEAREWIAAAQRRAEGAGETLRIPLLCKADADLADALEQIGPTS